MNRYSVCKKPPFAVPFHPLAAFSTSVVAHQGDPEYNFSTITTSRNSVNPWEVSTKTSTVDPFPSPSTTKPNVFMHCGGSLMRSLVSPQATSMNTLAGKYHVMEQMPSVTDGGCLRKIRRKFISCANLTSIITRDRNEIKVVNMADKVEKNRSETETSISGDSDSSPPLSKTFGKYTALLRASQEKFQGNPEMIGQLFSEFFSELSGVLPSYGEPLSLLGELAKSLKSDQNCHKPARIVQKHPQKHKTIPQSKREPKVPVESMSPQPIAEKNVSKDLSKGRKSSKIVTKGVDLLTSVKKRKSVKVPTLKLDEIAGKTKEYNEEFLENEDLFSQSWREECMKMKTVAYRKNEISEENKQFLHKSTFVVITLSLYNHLNDVHVDVKQQQGVQK
eukprot:TRINITY_DN105551_c4_g1_i1.p1 TRINITY_DN105551_c4_g1~~TRINITY_DN105551_c4_g1_i1.p1  ORF type:complete len:391 (-),score=13.99 TRINITY_DN105551_c4_g1_i1:843-2015(-)